MLKRVYELKLAGLLAQTEYEQPNVPKPPEFGQFKEKIAG
jgi:hypothetical protein